MKKLLCIMAAMFCLTACGSSEEKEQKVTCNIEKKSSSYAMTTSVDFKYAENFVSTQEQKVKVKVEDKATYEQMRPLMEAASLANKVKDMKGITYNLDFDDKGLTIEEGMKIDIAKVSIADYATITGKSASSIKEMKINMEKTRESFVKQGYTCSEMN